MSTPHSFKSSYGQCACRWCKRRGGDCDVTHEIRMAFVRWKKIYGTRWKDHLRMAWMTGNYGHWSDDTPAYLQRFRNMAHGGPRGLDRITGAMVDRYAALHQD